MNTLRLNLSGNKHALIPGGFGGFICCAAVAWSQNLSASEPIWVENLAPLAGLISLPAQRGAPLPSGWRVDTHLAVASHFVMAESAADTVIFDGETTRYSLAVEYGWQERWSLRLTVPWIMHRAGFLDGAINSWHEAFGLRDGGREVFPKDQFRFQYRSSSHEVSSLSGGDSVGDIRLEVNRRLFQSPDHAAALTLGYKAATGEVKYFTGSGSEDIFATLRYSGKGLWQTPLSWHTQVGVTWAGTSELLGPNQRRSLWFAGLGFEWPVANRWSVLAQFDSHSEVLDSPVRAVGSTSGLLSFGLRFSPSPSWAFEVSFIEDIIVETAPDVTFQASLRWRPRGANPH